MNQPFVKFLIRKDFFLFRGPILAYSLAAIASLIVASGNRVEMFYLGSILILTVLISLGIHIAFGMILEERTRKTLPFVLSMPVTPSQYLIAKLLASLALFLIPWTIVLGGMWIAVLSQPTLPNGVAPFFTVVLLELLAATSVLIAFALLTESMAWTIAIMVTNNIFINLYLPWLGRFESVQSANKSELIQWPTVLLAFTLVEAVVILLAFAAVLTLQRFKRNYIQ